MTPAQAIAMLDRQLAQHGQAIAFKRSAIEQSAIGFVRSYKVEQLVGLISQKDRDVTVSPTSLGTYLPRENDDFAVLDGAALGKVMAAEAIRIGSTVVRWNLRVRLS